MIIAVGSLITESAAGGLISFALFDFPSAIVMVFCALYYKSAIETQVKIPAYVDVCLHGFSCSAVAIVFQAALGFSNKNVTDRFSVFLLAVSSSIYLMN
jgi:chromate transport protein ChrA